MSREKQETQQTQRAEPTPEERELNKLLLERTRATQGQTIGVQQQGLDLIGQLLAGESLPGYLGQLPGGISEQTTSRIVSGALEDVRPGLQASGLFDSGVRAELETETAADIRAQAEQFNLQNLQQLLNIAVGGQAQVQAPILSQSAQLGQNLAGLRTVTGTSTTTSMNPFLRSFQTSFGENLGSFGKNAITGAFE